jgi:hypothetical protein
MDRLDHLYRIRHLMESSVIEFYKLPEREKAYVLWLLIGVNDEIKRAEAWARYAVLLEPLKRIIKRFIRGKSRC